VNFGRHPIDAAVREYASRRSRFRQNTDDPKSSEATFRVYVCRTFGPAVARKPKRFRCFSAQQRRARSPDFRSNRERTHSENNPVQKRPNRTRSSAQPTPMTCSVSIEMVSYTAAKSRLARLCCEVTAKSFLELVPLCCGQRPHHPQFRCIQFPGLNAGRDRWCLLRRPGGRGPSNAD